MAPQRVRGVDSGVVIGRLELSLLRKPLLAQLPDRNRNTVCTGSGANYELRIHVSGESFLTPPGPLSDLIARAVARETGLTPELSTTGGTSDARFIKDFCPVAEFGLAGSTMHKVDERVPVQDLETLTRIYEGVLEGYFPAP